MVKSHLIYHLLVSIFSRARGNNLALSDGVSISSAICAEDAVVE
jgi:hypothetical protein